MKTKFFLPLVFALTILFLSGTSVAQEHKLPAIAQGKFKPSDESLKQYEYPAWFRDAKFGIWSHWDPQAVPRQGDWYAKRMYLSETRDRRTGEVGGPDPAYLYHVKHYGHPSLEVQFEE